MAVAPFGPRRGPPPLACFADPTELLRYATGIITRATGPLPAFPPSVRQTIGSEGVRDGWRTEAHNKADFCARQDQDRMMQTGSQSPDALVLVRWSSRAWRRCPLFWNFRCQALESPCTMRSGSNHCENRPKTRREKLKGGGGVSMEGQASKRGLPGLFASTCLYRTLYGGSMRCRYSPTFRA